MIKRIIFVAIFLSITSTAFAVSKERLVKKGNAFYKKGDFSESLKNYEDALKSQPDSPAINFNLGTALYKDGKYDQAVGHLQKGLLAEDPTLQKNTHFNLGNALYQQGLSFEQGHIDQAIAALTESLRHFETVMNVDDKDTDAGYNHTIVQKDLERLKKEKQQQKQRNKDHQQQNSDKDQKEQDSDKEEQQKHDQNQGNNSSSDKSDQQNDSSESSPKNDQDGQANQDQQKPQQGFSQNQDDTNKSQNADKENAAQVQPGEMTQEEARSLLKQFEQGQESVGLLNLGQHQSVERPVLKDW